MHRRWFPLLVAALGLLAPAAANAQTTSCPGADTTISAATVSSAKAAVLCIVNAERTARGLPALTENDKLATAAQAHSDDMVAQNYFAHEGLDLSQPWDRILAAGYSYALMFENIATGQSTPREAVADWLASTHGHCQATLDPKVTNLGVGVAPTAATLPGQIGGTWTEEFGLPLGATPASLDSGPASGCPYTSFAGLSPAKQPDASGSPSSGSSGSSSGSGSGSGGTTTTPSTTSSQPSSSPTQLSAPAQALTISLRHAGATLTIGGALRPKWTRGRRVSITVRQGRHVRHLRARLNARGRFHIRLRRVSTSAGRLTVTVRCGRLRVTRTIGR